MAVLFREAKASGISEEIAIAIYNTEFQRLSAVATVKRFVAVIAERRARDALRAGVRGPSGRPTVVEAAKAKSDAGLPALTANR